MWPLCGRPARRASRHGPSWPADSEARGLIGAGGIEPLLARTSGRVQSLFFLGGEYVRRGQLLVKLFDHTFVLSPRMGFWGRVRLVSGSMWARPPRSPRFPGAATWLFPWCSRPGSGRPCRLATPCGCAHHRPHRSDSRRHCEPACPGPFRRLGGGNLVAFTRVLSHWRGGERALSK